MKRAGILLLLCLVLLLWGCAAGEKEIAEPEFRSGVYDSRFWETEECDQYDYYAIPNVATAIRVAQGLYAGYPVRAKERDYAVQEVFFNVETEVWVVYIGPELPETGPVATDMGCSFALRSKDGTLLGINSGG